jgi:HK97 family phage major capsid protein
MPPTAVPTRESLLTLAQQIISRSGSGDFSKADEARVRSLTHLIGAVSGDQRKQDVSTENFRRFLMTGEVRANLSGEGPSGGAYPGSTSGYFAPVEFVHSVINAMAFISDVWSPDVATHLNTGAGRPISIPLSDDLANPAVIVDENTAITPLAPFQGQLSFPISPRFKAACFVSLELQDSGIPIDAYIRDRFAIRFQLGTSGMIAAGLLAGSTGIPASGAVENDGSGLASNSIGSDDIGALIDAAGVYAEQPKSGLGMNFHTLTKLLALRTTSGALVFPHAKNKATGKHEFLGLPAIILPGLPSVEASAFGTVVCGDFSRLVLRLGPMSVLGSWEVAGGVESGLFHFRGLWPIQCAVAQDTSTSPLDSPFTALQQGDQSPV